MHLPTIHCGPTVEIPSILGLSSKLSSSSSSSTCSLFLLSFIGLVILGAVLSLKVLLSRKQKLRTASKPEKEQTQTRRRTWRTLLGGWDGVNLPVTLTAAAPSSTVVGRGIGLNGAVLEKQMTQIRPIRSGPTFEQPLPAIYQSKEPLSMAKMIMSRHTFRRPSPSQRVSVVPRRSTSLPPPPSVSGSRPQSMV